MEQLHITDDFFGDEFKESDFPGVFPQHNRKPHTPRRKVTIADDHSSPDKKNKPARRRSRSQSSQEGDSVVSTDEVKMKDELKNKISPLRKRNSNDTSTDTKSNDKKSKATQKITQTLMEIEHAEKEKTSSCSFLPFYFQSW